MVKAYVFMFYYWIERLGVGNWGTIWSNPDGCKDWVSTLPRTYDNVPVRVNEECWLGFAWVNSSMEAEESVTGHATLELVSPTDVHYTLEPIAYQDVTADPCWLPGGDYTSGVWLPFGMWKFNEPGTWTAKMHLTDADTEEVLDEPETLFLIVGEPASPSLLYGGGNRHLVGDVNFDGIVNLTDVQMVQSQVGNDFTCPWGTCSECYNPNADFDMDGFIGNYDLTFVKSRLGATSPWYCVTKNPRFLDEGEGWETVAWTNIYAYFIIPLNFGQYRAGTTYSALATGFRHYLDMVNLIIPIPYPYSTFLPFLALAFNGSAFTAATIGDDFLPDPNNPQPSPYDVPLDPDNQDFYIKSNIDSWTMDPESILSWLTYGFGGWIILENPYTIHLDVTAPIFGEMLPSDLTSRVIQVLFNTKDQCTDIIEYFPKTVPIGGNDWNRIWTNLWPPYSHFFVFQYTMDDQPLGMNTYHLTSSTFANLIDKIVDASLSDENMLTNVPTPINSIIVSSLSFAKLRDLDLTGAKFRPAFIGLQGKADLGAVGYVGATVHSYNFEFYDQKKGVVWQPALSPEVTVNVE